VQTIAKITPADYPDLLAAVDAGMTQRELADRFHVYTLPTTVVMSPEGRSLHVNYGYAPANKLERQLADARRPDLRATASA